MGLLHPYIDILEVILNKIRKKERIWVLKLNIDILSTQPINLVQMSIQKGGPHESFGFSSSQKS
jgi:hypothetical protein